VPLPIGLSIDQFGISVVVEPSATVKKSSGCTAVSALAPCAVVATPLVK